MSNRATLRQSAKTRIAEFTHIVKLERKSRKHRVPPGHKDSGGLNFNGNNEERNYESWWPLTIPSNAAPSVSDFEDFLNQYSDPEPSFDAVIAQNVPPSTSIIEPPDPATHPINPSNETSYHNGSFRGTPAGHKSPSDNDLVVDNALSSPEPGSLKKSYGSVWEDLDHLGMRQPVEAKQSSPWRDSLLKQLKADIRQAQAENRAYVPRLSRGNVQRKHPQGDGSYEPLQAGGKRKAATQKVPRKKP
ncbi:hypothetical protein FRB94_002686, partial [Tulasnella sp. JGI-2019a]